MPDIFAKNAKIRLIEYGSNQQGLEALSEMKAKFTSFLSNLIKH